MNLLSKSILRITRKSAQETSCVGTNAVLRIVFGLILAYVNSLGCRSGQVSVPWVASPLGQGSPVAAELEGDPHPDFVVAGVLVAVKLPLGLKQGIGAAFAGLEEAVKGLQEAAGVAVVHLLVAVQGGAGPRRRQLAVIGAIRSGPVGAGEHQAAALQRVLPIEAGRCGRPGLCAAARRGRFRQKETMGGDMQDPRRLRGRAIGGGSIRAKWRGGPNWSVLPA
jgi:hypothetical protein